MTIQITSTPVDTTTYFVVGFDHDTCEFFVAVDKTYEHFGECNTEVTDADEYPGMNIEWTSLGYDENNELANDLHLLLGAEND